MSSCKKKQNGAGAYVDNDVGGAAGTGDGDIMMQKEKYIKIQKSKYQIIQHCKLLSPIIFIYQASYEKYFRALLLLLKML